MNENHRLELWLPSMRWSLCYYYCRETGRSMHTSEKSLKFCPFCGIEISPENIKVRDDFTPRF